MSRWSTSSPFQERGGPRLARAVLDLLRTSITVVGLVACTTEPEAPLPPGLASLPELPAAASDVALPRGAEQPVRELTFALVGEVRGEIEPCGCPTLPYGGFERRERLLDQLRAQEAVVHLDAGETLVKGLVTTSIEERTARARDVLGLSKSVGVQAWTPGPTDLLALGTEGLARVQSGRLPGPPPISATWEDPSGALLLPPSRVIEVAGKRVGVIGLSAAPTAPEVAHQVRMRDPVAAARSALSGLPSDLDLVVALGSVADADADRVAAEVEGIGLLLTTRGVAADEPRQVELPEQGALVVESTDRGRYLTLVRTHLASDTHQPLVLHPGRQDWKTLHTARARVDTLRSLPAATDGGDPSVDAHDPAVLAAAVDALAEREADFVAEGRGRNLAYVSTVPLAENLDGETRIGRQIRSVKDEVVQRAEVRATQPVESQGPHYAASSACVSCHVSETARWAYSDHATAWRSLVKRGEEANVECVGCHATGFGEPGGFGELTSGNTGRFKAVQCEACHGPMGGHPGNPDVQPTPISPEVCVRCHDPANSPDFDYATYLPRATCQGGAPEVMSTAP